MMLKNGFLKKALQGSKNDYITTNLFYYYLFRTDETKQLIIKKNSFMVPSKSLIY